MTKNMTRQLIGITLIGLTGYLTAELVLYLSSVVANVHMAFDVKTYISFLFNARIIILLGIIFFLLFLTNQMSVFSVSTIRKAANTLVYLHALTLFLPWTIVPFSSFLPNGPRFTMFLFSLLFIITIFFILPLKKNQNNLPIPFKLFVFWIVFSTIAGVFSGIMGFDHVKANLPLLIQLKNGLLIADAFLVYYVIVKNDWGFKEFERLLSIILWGGLVISIECLVTFYFGGSNMFSSILIGRHYYPGIIGISLTFISLYFLYKYQKIKLYYLVLTILGFLLAFSTLSRSVLLSYIIGLMVFLVLYFKYGKISRKRLMLLSSIISVCVILIPIGFYFLAEKGSELKDGYTSGRSLWSRSYRHSRALDVFVKHPVIGVGFGLVPYYSHSSSIPPTLSSYASSLSGTDFSRRGKIYDVSSLYMHADQFETVHSVLFDFIVGFGLCGLLFIIFIIYTGVKIFRYIIFFAKKYKGKYDLVYAFAVCSLVLGVCLVVQTTSKFQSYWYYSILFGFLNLIYRDLVTKSQNNLPA